MTFELNHEDCSNDAEFVLTKVSINICPSSSEGNFFRTNVLTKGQFDNVRSEITRA